MHISENLCRICLGKHNLNDIYAEKSDVIVVEKIMYCAAVQISKEDALPKMICNQCLFYLDIAYIFKTVCEATDRKLKSLSMDENSELKPLEDNDSGGSSEKDQTFVENDFLVLNQDEETLYVPASENYIREEVIGIASTENDEEEDVPMENCESLQKNEINDKTSNQMLDSGQLEQDHLNENGKNKVGRHIARKIAGKYPRRLRQGLSPLKEMKNSKCNINCKVSKEFIINDFNFCQTQDEEFTKVAQSCNTGEPILESDLPIAIFEETVESVKNFENLVEPSELQVNNVLLPKRDYGLRRKRGKKQKFKYNSDKNFKLKIKINPVKTKNNKAKRKVNVFNDRTKKTTKEDSSLETTKNSQNDSKDFHCDICGKTFPYRSHLIRHLTVHTGIKRHTCEYCQKQFINSYNLSVHMQKHTGDFPLTCEICGKGYSTPSLLKRHLNSLHARKSEFQCKYCLQKFKQSSSMKLHERMHLHRPSYTCDICFKIFSYTNSLAAHKKTHLGFKDYVCNVCNKAFTRNQSLIRHMLVHKVETKKMQCKHCSLCFSSNGNYLAHLKSHFKHRCDYCDEGFQNRTLLVNHLKKHKDKLRCEQCFKLFSSKNQLIKHLEKHINVKK